MAKNKKNSSTDSENTAPNKKKEIIDFAIWFVVCLALCWFILTYVGQRTVVNGSSMDNTLADGQNLIMDKLSYRFHDPERFDIVIFPGPKTDGSGGTEPYIKRVIGLPGETVQIKDGKVYINDKQLTSDVYGITDYIDDPGVVAEPYTLGDDEYFCMGDNRPVSYDCRQEAVGMVHKDQFMGKAIFRIWPLSKFGPLK